MRHILNIRAFKIIATMDEMMDKEISFLEKSCEQLSRDIEMYSTPTDKRAQARDSGIATMVGASGGQSHLKSPSADDSVILQRNERSGWPIAESTDTDNVTVRQAKAQKKSNSNEVKLADVLYTYTLG